MKTLKLTKRFGPYAAAHRQYRHSGHCKKIHGHNWSFEFTFVCDKLDECGFVVDVGLLGWVRTRVLEDMFDHTLILQKDDPERKLFELFLEKQGLAKIVWVEDGSMEGLARLLYQKVEEVLSGEWANLRTRGVRLARVTVWEDERNFVEFEPENTPRSAP